MGGVSKIEERNGRYVLMHYDENNPFGRVIREFASEEDAKEYDALRKSIVCERGGGDEPRNKKPI